MAEALNPQHILVTCADKPAKLLLALPVFQTLKSAFPKAKITVFVTSGAEGMLQEHPAVDAIESITKLEGLMGLTSRFKGLSPDICLHLMPTAKLVLAAWMAKIPVRIGMDYKWQGFFLTHSIKINRAVSDRNEVEYNFELLKPLGITQFASKIEFPLGEGDKSKVKEILSQKGIGLAEPYILVHPGSKGRARHWKAERFGQLLGYLCQVKGLRVVLTAEADESALIAEVTAFLFSLPMEQKPVLIITNDLNLKQLAALCQGAVCVLTSPTGPMQLAAAVGAPMVAIFSPAPESTPVRWGPWGNENTVLVPKNPQCSACEVGYCRKHDPMDGLTVPEVFDAMKKYIQKVVPV